MAVITAAAIGTAGTLFAQKKASSAAKSQAKLGQQAIDAADPYKQYRGDAAIKLNSLMDDPSSITNSAEYKARQTAAERTMAAQGYTGSGNAIHEAATASGASYQQAFDNLSMLSGARNVPGGGFDSALGANQSGIDNKLSANAGTVSSLSNLALTVGKRLNPAAPPSSSRPPT